MIPENPTREEAKMVAIKLADAVAHASEVADPLFNIPDWAMSEEEITESYDKAHRAYAAAYWAYDV